MAFSETIYLNLAGGVIQPISKVTAQLATSNVVIYNGDTYRDDPVELLGYYSSLNIGTATTIGTPSSLYAGHAQAINSAGTQSSTPAVYASDKITHTAPRYHGKQVTLWTFAREVTAGVAGFSHVVWAHLVESTGDYAAFRMGSTPPTIS